MFEQKKYKQFAKKQLEHRWTVPVLISLICFLIEILFNIPGIFKTLRSGFGETLNNISSYREVLAAYNAYTAQTTSRFSTIIQTMVNSVLSMASIGVYLKMSRNPEPVSLSLFIEGLNNWFKAILAGIWQLLWTFLWSLLFFIPGIIKSIAYSQTFYIISEYENISVTKAMRISILITDGHKADLFMTYLSFIGWFLLCVLTLGIAAFWVDPYVEMTLVNAYHAMLKEAIESGKLKPEDLSE